MSNNVTIQLICTKINSQFNSGYPLTRQFGDAREDDWDAPAVIKRCVGDTEAEDSLGGTDASQSSRKEAGRGASAAVSSCADRRSRRGRVRDGGGEVERTFPRKVGQTGLLAFEFLNEGILKTEVERILRDLIVFICG